MTQIGPSCSANGRGRLYASFAAPISGNKSADERTSTRVSAGASTDEKSAPAEQPKSASSALRLIRSSFAASCQRGLFSSLRVSSKIAASATASGVPACGRRGQEQAVVRQPLLSEVAA
jgi:hypothetical protein